MARAAGFDGQIVTRAFHRKLGISDAALKNLVCNACDVSEEFVGPNRLDWNELVIGKEMLLHDGRFVVVEVEQRTRTAWLIEASQLEEVN